jgi:NADH-quinone oxidoreductase subunit J
MAALYFLLGGYFLGAVQLIVYAGGTLVLIVFGVMLTARSPQVSFEPRWFEMAAGAGICAVLLATLLHVVLRTTWPGAAEAGDVPDATVAAIGQQFLGDYLVPFEAASILLLVVMIGAAFLARPIRRNRRRSQRDA